MASGAGASWLTRLRRPRPMRASTTTCIGLQIPWRAPRSALRPVDLSRDVATHPIALACRPGLSRYRVVRAYWEGAWLPAGYFLNAAVLAGLWTVAGTVVAGLTLSGVAAALVRTGQAAFDRCLDRVVGDLRAQVAQSLSGPLSSARAVLEPPTD